MAIDKLTNEEAKHLLEMLKKSLVSSINFPDQDENVEFDLEGDTKKDSFVTKIYRGKVDPKKYELSARIKKNNTLLLELHICKNKIHRNPDGTKIIGSHWHIYTEKYGRAFAYKAENIESDKFIENTMMFLEKFNVIEKPTINMQLELF